MSKLTDDYGQDGVMIGSPDDEREFELMMERAFAEPAAEVPAGLEARMQAWTALAMDAQRAGLAHSGARSTKPVSRFKDFGVLDTGASSRRALFASTAMNLAVAAVLMFVVGVVGGGIAPPHTDTATIVAPVTPPIDETRVPPVIARVLPPTPVVQPRVEQPVELPPDVKPLVSATPRVNLVPPAPARVEATPGSPASRTPAPKAVSLSAVSAQAPGALPRVGAVALGGNEGLKTALTGPPVSAVSLNAGVAGGAGLSAGRVGPLGPVHIGPSGPSGPGNGGSLHGAAPVAIAGPVSGTPGGKDKGDKGAVEVQISPIQQQLVPTVRAEAPSLKKPPTVTYMPKPSRTEEAKALHVEGDVTIRVRLLANGSVEVLGVARGLGHGLDEAALQAAKSIRFMPATDAAGSAVDFATVVTVHFVTN